MTLRSIITLNKTTLSITINIEALSIVALTKYQHLAFSTFFMSVAFFIAIMCFIVMLCCVFIVMLSVIMLSVVLVNGVAS